MTASPDLSIIIPVYNEATRIDRNIAEIVAFFDRFSAGCPCEIIFVNDGSTDSTLDVLRKHIGGRPNCRIVSYDKNRGKGHAVRQGILAANGSWSAFVDIDLAVPLAEFERALPHMHGGDYAVILGSRRMAGSSILVAESFARRFFGEGYRWTSRMFVPEVTDFTCGYKLFRRDAAQRIFQAARIDRWAFDTEIIYLAKRFGFAILQLPVPWSHDVDSRVRIFRDVMRSLHELALIVWYRLTGAYR